MTIIALAILLFVLSFQNCSEGSSPSLSDSPTTPLSLDQVVLPLEKSKNERFNIVWLEPQSINISVLGREGQATSEDLRKVLQTYKRMGIATLVVAYSEFLNQILFKSQKEWSYVSFNKNDKGEILTSTVHSKSSYNGLLKDGDFMDVLMMEAEALGLNVYLGLSRTGDLHLLGDIYHTVKGDPEAMVFPGYDVNARLNTALFYSKQVANELWSRYSGNPSFSGWYLTHETSCLDVGLNYYRPMAEYLKHISPKQKVMISPLSNAKSCFSTKSYLDLVEENKNLIDVYAYQDSIGAGSLYVNGIPQNLYSDAARIQRIVELMDGRLEELKLIHAQTGTQFWMNTEAWEMKGTSCPLGELEGDGSGNRYGCPYPGDWSRVSVQLKNWAEYTPHLMLNEGFSQFDFDIGLLSFSDPVNRHKAKAFTNQYLGYLLGKDSL